MFSGGPRRGRFGRQNLGMPGETPTPEAGGDNTGMPTTLSRREAVLNALRERRSQFQQPGPGTQPGGFAAPGGLRARVLERLNQVQNQNPNVPPQDKGPV